MTDEELLSGIDQIIEQAPSVGLCPLPFKLIRERVSELVAERNQLQEEVGRLRYLVNHYIG